MQNPIGCLVFLVIGILFPFFGGTICAFAVGGWLLGIGAIIYNVFALWLCTKFKEEKIGCTYCLLMLPMYCLQIFGLLNGISKGGI